MVEMSAFQVYVLYPIKVLRDDGNISQVLHVPASAVQQF